MEHFPHESVLSRKGLSQRKGSDFPSHWSKSQIKPRSDTLGTLKSCFEGGICVISLLPSQPGREKLTAEKLVKEKDNRRSKNLPKVPKLPQKAPNKPLTEA